MDIICSPDWSKIFELLTNASATLLAAFLGAWFAFRLHSKSEISKLRAKNVQNANLALSLLSDQAQQISSILMHLVPIDVDEESRHFVIKPIVPDNNIQFLALDLEPLAFALEGEPTVISGLSSMQRDINTGLGLVKERSQLHINFLQPAVEAIQAEYGGEEVRANFPELLRAKLGFRRDFELRDATDRMIAGLLHGRDCAERGFSLLKKAVLRVHPDAKLIPEPAI